MLTSPLLAYRTSGGSTVEVSRLCHAATSGARARFSRMSAIPYRRTFARLLGFLKPYKLSLAVSIVLAVGYQGSQIAVVWVTKHIIDGALQPHDSSKLWIFVGAIVALGLARAVLMYGRRMISGRQALAVEMDLRQGLYSHLGRLSL